MKRLVGFILFVLVTYAIYYDLSHGTLPTFTEPKIVAKTQEEMSINFFEKEVEHGDTVLTIVERQLNKAIPVSIQEVVTDFNQLNNGIRPEEIQYGKTYKFPDYSEQTKNDD